MVPLWPWTTGGPPFLLVRTLIARLSVAWTVKSVAVAGPGVVGSGLESVLLPGRRAAVIVVQLAPCVCASSVFCMCEGGGTCGWLGRPQGHTRVHRCVVMVYLAALEAREAGTQFVRACMRKWRSSVAFPQWKSGLRRPAQRAVACKVGALGGAFAVAMSPARSCGNGGWDEAG